MKIKSPARPVYAFPPEGTVASHRVKTGDNWWNLASRYGFADPWTIIEFNYRTRVPEEVNWYLKHFVGCTKSNDGKNYSFDSSDAFGVVYIPPQYWKPDAKYIDLRGIDTPVTNAVHSLTFLKLPIIDPMQIHDAFNTYMFVVADPNLPVVAEYNYRNHYFLRTSKDPKRIGVFDSVMLAKEACHIAFGTLGSKAHFYAETEAISLICARIYHRSRPEWRKLPFSPLQYFVHTPRTEALRIVDEFVDEFQKGRYIGDLTSVTRLVQREPYYMQRLFGHWPRGAARAA
jgi:hypothetical protein